MTTTTLKLLSLLLLPAILHCDSGSAESAVQAPLAVQLGGPFPATWSSLEAELDGRELPFEPLFPLWTDGLAKLRTVTPPPGVAGTPTQAQGADDLPDPDAIAVGTVFTKTLASQDGVPLETRVLVARHADTQDPASWELAVYLWNADGSDAHLLDGKAPTPIPGTNHVVPSHRQCQTCHASAPSFVLGYTATQLGHEPLLPSSPPPTAQAKTAIGWVLGNCAHCHNGGTGPSSVYDLRPTRFADNTVCRETTGSMSAPGKRIVPGSPETSILYRAVRGGDSHDGVAAMPPLGVTTPDPEGVAAIEAYILSLEGECPPDNAASRPVKPDAPDAPTPGL